HFNSPVRRRIEGILREAFAGTSVDFAARVSESVLARLHIVVHTDPATTPDYDVAAIEARLAAATRTWSDDLRDALIDQLGEERAARLWRRYADAFPAAYRDDFTPRAAVADIQRIEQLDPEGDLAMSLYLPLESPAGHLA